MDPRASFRLRALRAVVPSVLLPISILLPVQQMCALGADITGTITVKQRLTRPSVTAGASLYQRGPAVELGKDAETDPLAAERARVVIWVEESAGGARTARVPARSSVPVASMQQLNRRFDPDILVIAAGSSVGFPNLDPIFHNVFSLSRPKSFDLGNFPKGETRIVEFPSPGIVNVDCRLHPNMAGVIVVAPNRWYAKAGRDGQFALHDLPPGEYTVVAWHKSTGFIRKQVHVDDGRDSVVNFFVPVDIPASGASPMKLTLQ